MTLPRRRIDLGDIPCAALLNRPPIALDAAPLRALVQGQRVLVTGAGGSIGSELCRQVAAAHPSALVMVDRYENGLHAVALELGGHGFPQPIIGDITDAGRMRAIFEATRPHLVLHAAAHKHVPLMEANPGEAVKNNVTGTRIVAETAARHGAAKFVLISTDKAVRPSSVMGATKRAAELVVRDVAERSRPGIEFVTVRFGNVLGSNGSVLPRFVDQINAGGPITVTHPEVRRFFMLIPEAAQLVLHAAVLSDQPELCVLDLGEQTNIASLARTILQLAVPDVDIPIVFIGLRPGEKLSEILVGDDEDAVPSSVPQILKVKPKKARPVLMFAERLRLLEAASLHGSDLEVLTALTTLVPGFAPNRVPMRVDATDGRRAQVAH
jgi:FlaA1/EpsC-like NDP-sugar epimerase